MREDLDDDAPGVQSSPTKKKINKIKSTRDINDESALKQQQQLIEETNKQLEQEA